MANSTEYKNLFEEILDYMLRVLNIIKGSSMYDQAIAVSSHIINSNFENNQSKIESDITNQLSPEEYYNFENNNNMFHQIDKDNNCKI
jgi:hypothetical protein